MKAGYCLALSLIWLGFLVLHKEQELTEMLLLETFV